MSDEHLNPAKTIIAKIGVDKTAEVTGKHVSRVYRWMYPKERGGTGGLIPQTDQPAILQYALSRGIDLSPADFFPSPKRETAA